MTQGVEQPMRYGAVFPQTEIGIDPIAIRDYAQAVEGLGYDYLLAYDHVLGADPEGRGGTWPYTYMSTFHEPLALFCYLAGLTERIELVSGVVILPQRQTALVAKQAAEADILSGGRVILGVGSGWNYLEYESLGEDFHTRGRRLEEQVGLLRRLWSEPIVEFEGDFDRIPTVGINPRPARQIPIWMGGTAPVVLDRIGRIGDGWLVGRGGLEYFARSVEAIHEAAERAARDPSEIGIGASVAVHGAPEEQVAFAERLQEAGADRIHVLTMDAGLDTPGDHIDALRVFMEAARPAGG